MFECRQKDDGTFTIKVQESSKPYFSQLNQRRWLTAMKEYAQRTDIFTCPICNSDVVPEDEL